MKEKLKMWYIFLIGFLVGGIFQTVLINVQAQTLVCDIEVFIFAMNNDLEKLEDCISAENEIQDARMDIVDERMDMVESRIATVENVTKTIYKSDASDTS